MAAAQLAAGEFSDCAARMGARLRAGLDGLLGAG
jgi:hypothetical protein